MLSIWQCGCLPRLVWSKMCILLEFVSSGVLWGRGWLYSRWVFCSNWGMFLQDQFWDWGGCWSIGQGECRGTGRFFLWLLFWQVYCNWWSLLFRTSNKWSHRGPEFNDVVQGVLDRKRSSLILDEGDDRMSVSICNYVQWCRGLTNDDGSAEDGG